MSDYIGSIIAADYLYNGKVYYTNASTTNKTNLIVKLILTETDFNFDLALDDGSDFRLVDYEFGVGILKTWIACWDVVNKYAVLFFQIPYIEAETSVVFTAYWGNEYALSIENPNDMEFIFYEGFKTNLSTSKWTGTLNSIIGIYGYPFEYTTFTTTTNPLEGMCSWVVEAGIYSTVANSSWNDDSRSYRFQFLGESNPFIIDVYRSHKISHNITQPNGATTNVIDETYGGLELGSYQEQYISYVEADDAVYFKLLHRDTYPDITNKISRKVEADTLLSNILIGYRDSSRGDYGAIRWLVVREYNDTLAGDLDGSGLFISTEAVHELPQDFREFGENIVSCEFKHYSEAGGTPENISNPTIDSSTTSWVSNDDVSISGTEIIMYTAQTGNLANISRSHYDSSHSYLYPASKLSDFNLDEFGRDYWRCTTTSGWAAIKFDNPVNIATLKVVGMDDYINSMPKDVVMYGSNFYPTKNFLSAKEIGSIEPDVGVNTFTLYTNNREYYKYYIMDIKDTYGDIIRIKEWEMYPHSGRNEYYFISQLRLTPAIYSGAEYSFPYEISLLGSIDDSVWYTLMDWTRTYNPFVEHYVGYGRSQRYTVPIIKGSLTFKLLCKGNWGSGQNNIIIGSWGLYELASEAYTYRILEGDTNNIKQIWADNMCELDDKHNTIYLANNKLNIVVDDRGNVVEDLPVDYEDFNVV